MTNAAVGTMSVVTVLWVIFAVLTLYFFPTIIAFYRKNLNKGQVLAVNMLLGFTVIGYIVAWVMAFSYQTEYTKKLDMAMNARLNNKF